MKVLNAAGSAWVGVPPTNKTKVTDYPAYMLFIRGNRSYPMSSTSDKTPASSTVLRVTGSVNQGVQTARAIAASGMTLVANPHACPVNFTENKSGKHQPQSPLPRLGSYPGRHQRCRRMGNPRWHYRHVPRHTAFHTDYHPAGRTGLLYREC